MSKAGFGFSQSTSGTQPCLKPARQSLLHHLPALWGSACLPVLHAAQRCVGHLRHEGLQLSAASSSQPGIQALCLCRGDAVACQPLCHSLQTWAWVTHCSCRTDVLQQHKVSWGMWLYRHVQAHNGRRNLGLAPLQERGGR